ncbi:MAG TPA: NHL repeat-containing protein [Acidimicrobiales bacterium]|nr:NHL repeat-containing protein [Acidimicrobiales bacterium]
MTGRRARRTITLAALAAVAALVPALPAAVAGATAGPTGTGDVVLSGLVKADGQPVTTATVTLVEAGGTTGGADTDLGTATTDTKGSFTLPYRPPAATTQLLVRASGGTAGGHQVGAARQLLAALGTASAVPGSVTVDELTTVAAVYALHQFFDGHAAAVAGPAPGLPNAMATAANLADPATGKVSIVVANPPNGNASATLATFNTLATLVGTCTAGTAATCRRLFAAVTAPGQATPTNTVQAVYDLADDPAGRLKGPFALVAAATAGTATRSRPYRPLLTTPPNAWVLTLAYTSGGFDAPGKLAIDAQGNLWSGNNFTAPGSAGPGLVVLNPVGVPAYGTPIVGGGIDGVGWGTMVDQQGRVWIGNFKGNSVSLLGPAGQVLSPPQGFTAGNLSKPQGVVVDQDGNVWIANFGNASVTEYPGGDPAQARTITGGGITKPFGLAVAADGTVWVTDGAEAKKPGAVSRITPDGTVAADPVTGPGLRSPQGLAIDSTGDVWVANLFGDSVVRIASDGALVGKPLRGRGIGGPWGIAVDGDDNIWVADFFKKAVVELCGQQAGACPKGIATGQPISPASTGFTSAATQHLTDVAIDQSGNVWAVNNFSAGSPLKHYVGGDGFIELVGQAAPVATPQVGPPRQP